MITCERNYFLPVGATLAMYLCGRESASQQGRSSSSQPAEDGVSSSSEEHPLPKINAAQFSEMIFPLESQENLQKDVILPLTFIPGQIPK